MNYDGDVRWWRSCLKGFTTSHLPGAPPPRPEVCCYGVHDAVFAAEHVAIRCARFLERFGRHYFAQRPRGLARPARAVTDRQEGQRVAQRVLTQRKQSFRRATLRARARHCCCARPETRCGLLAVLQRRRCDAQTTANEDLLVGGMSLALVGPPVRPSSRCLCFSSVLQHASLSKLQ